VNVKRGAEQVAFCRTKSSGRYASSMIDRVWLAHRHRDEASVKPALIKAMRIAPKQLFGTASQNSFFALVSAT
jgi:hypothetical protein